MSKKILIVEDSIDTRFLYRKALEMEDYEVAMVGSANEALGHLETNSNPDLVLLDLSLPDMDGAELMSAIRKDPRWAGLKIVIVSGWDNLKTRAKEIGADGCIRKPFELNKLYEEVEKYLVH